MSGKLLFRSLVALATVTLLSITTRASVVITGDVDPQYPESWRSNADGYVGKTGEGTLAVDGGDNLYSLYAYIGYEDTAIGEVTIGGPASAWVNSETLSVGYEGNGTLNVTDGATVASGAASIGECSGSP